MKIKKYAKKKGKCTRNAVAASANLQFVPNIDKRHGLQIRASEASEDYPIYNS